MKGQEFEENYPYVDKGNNHLYLTPDICVANNTIETKWAKSNKNYWINKGYLFTGLGDSFNVKIQDLTKGSEARVDRVCMYCGDISNVRFNSIIKKGRTMCNGCARLGDMKGKLCGRWKVGNLAGFYKKGGHAIWECYCSCGNPKMYEIRGSSLRSGQSQSCGCLRDELAAERCRKMNGENHYNWDFNKTNEEREAHRTREDIDWAYDVKMRDNFTCQCCGDNKGGNLESHHLNGHAKFPDQRFDINNGVTLCIPCHNRFHYKYMNNTREEFTYQDFIDFCYDYYPNALFLA